MTTPHEFFRELPELQTERLVLRALSPDDADVLQLWSQDPDMTRFAIQPPLRELDEALRLIELFARRGALGQPHPWAVCERSATGAAGQLVGSCGFGSVLADYGCADIGFQIAPEHWGRGFATEAARAVLRVGFGTLGLHRIEANCAVENAASARVLEKLGMCLEGTLRERMRVRGHYYDMRLFAILDREFEAEAGPTSRRLRPHGPGPCGKTIPGAPP